MVVLREPLMQPCAPYCSAGDDAVGKGSADQRLSRGSKWLILNLGAGAEPGGGELAGFDRANTRHLSTVWRLMSSSRALRRLSQPLPTNREIWQRAWPLI